MGNSPCLKGRDLDRGGVLLVTGTVEPNNGGGISARDYSSAQKRYFIPAEFVWMNLRVQ